MSSRKTVLERWLKEALAKREELAAQWKKLPRNSGTQRQREDLKSRGDAVAKKIAEIRFELRQAGLFEERESK